MPLPNNRLPFSPAGDSDVPTRPDASTQRKSDTSDARGSASARPSRDIRLTDSYTLDLDDAGRVISSTAANAPGGPATTPWMPPRRMPDWPPGQPSATSESAKYAMRQRWLALRDHPRLHGNAEKFTRLMVVDDNLDVRYAMHECLSAEGYDVSVASDGMSALALAKMTLPEAILLDIGMPALDGFSTARAFRRMTAFLHTPIVAITGFFDTEHINDARSAGFDFYFQKPVDIDALLALLRGDPV
ncbi:response regulator [Robbsia sp. KACC 23696]|uniref:response regulator n=1 Tax=Robbsia sp. KACC 23696 TaxID=3149231 RepID=UPI00325AE12C